MTGYIFLVASVLYLVFFVIRRMNAQKKQKEFRYRPAYFLIALIALGIGIYCLITGNDLSNFIR